MTDEELQDVVNEINDRPRKILAYRTACEVLTQLAQQEARVAINY